MKGLNEVNGEFRQLKAMISWGLDNYENLGININPCFGIRMPTAPPSNRYVTDRDYHIQLEYTCEKGWKWLAIFFELSFLLASRSVEVRHLKMDDANELGITVERRKGSHTNIISWSNRLRNAYAAAQKLKTDIARQKAKCKKKDCLSSCDHSDQLAEEHRIYLLVNPVGRIRKEALGSAMSRLKASMFSDGLENVYWTPHDLKRKGISDAETTAIAGHKSYEMQQRYNTKIRTYKLSSPRSLYQFKS